MPRSHHESTNNIKGQMTIFSPKPTSPMEMFANEIYLEETVDTEFKRTMVNSIKEYKEFKVDTKKQFNQIKELECKRN